MTRYPRFTERHMVRAHGPLFHRGGMAPSLAPGPLQPRRPRSRPRLATWGDRPVRRPHPPRHAGAPKRWPSGGPAMACFRRPRFTDTRADPRNGCSWPLPEASTRRRMGEETFTTSPSP